MGAGTVCGVLQGAWEGSEMSKSKSVRLAFVVFACKAALAASTSTPLRTRTPQGPALRVEVGAGTTGVQVREGGITSAWTPAANPSLCQAWRGEWLCRLPVGQHTLARVRACDVGGCSEWRAEAALTCIGNGGYGCPGDVFVVERGREVEQGTPGTRSAGGEMEVGE